MNTAARSTASGTAVRLVQPADNRAMAGWRAADERRQSGQGHRALAGRRPHPETPLTVLLFELVLASAYAPSVVAEMVVADGWAHVVRGPADIDASTFDASCLYSPTAGSLIARTS
jgi:hypothetical protein